MRKKIGLKTCNKGRVKRAIFAFALLVTLTVCLAAPGVYAGESEDPPASGAERQPPADQRSKPSNSAAIGELQGDLENTRGELDQARKSYKETVDEIKALESRIAALEAQIEDTEGEIEIKEAEIAVNDAILRDLMEQIVAMEQEIFDHNSALNKRLRIMYQTGDQSILAVLLSSESFVDFLSNIEMVQRIHESDKAFLGELEMKLSNLEAKRAEAKEVEAKLKAQRAELQETKERLDANKVELDAAKLRQQEVRDALQKDIDRLEAESKRIEQELVNMTSQWGDYAGGAMAWPVIGLVTSEFGMRTNPYTKQWAMHNGIDIAARTGTPIHAGADGLVYYTGWNNGGYGNLVMLDNGSGIVTLYAHCSGFAVAKGQVVHRGDIIAYVGSTGNSTGPHLHFEVRVSGAPQNPRGWLG